MSSHNRQNGFTLIEMIISLVVLALLGAAAGYGLTGGALAFSSSADAVHTLANLRYASERITREIREIRRDPMTPAVYDITTMNPGVLSFTKSDGTGVTLSSMPPLVTLAYSSPAGSHTLTDQLSSLVFSYYQADGITAATGNSDTAFIEFELLLTRDANLYPQLNRIALRNRQ